MDNKLTSSSKTDGTEPTALDDSPQTRYWTSQPLSPLPILDGSFRVCPSELESSIRLNTPVSSRNPQNRTTLESSESYPNEGSRKFLRSPRLLKVSPPSTVLHLRTSFNLPWMRKVLRPQISLSLQSTRQSRLYRPSSLQHGPPKT